MAQSLLGLVPGIWSRAGFGVGPEQDLLRHAGNQFAALGKDPAGSIASPIGQNSALALEQEPVGSRKVGGVEVDAVVEGDRHCQLVLVVVVAKEVGQCDSCQDAVV
ncbi:hypothetical protein AYI68_g3282 [Smittium mucronatum]|uniref:Uncharacterized protein n=1 Tax=Smittium mucronatum TaxID=133383 RepID=A0A1R0H0C9_9FUNG|nr:hypothetical protein AYI68_g3282 [Smittium mucronatum]